MNCEADCEGGDVVEEVEPIEDEYEDVDERTDGEND